MKTKPPLRGTLDQTVPKQQDFEMKIPRLAPLRQRRHPSLRPVRQRDPSKKRPKLFQQL
jgi:hypothetical protein